MLRDFHAFQIAKIKHPKTKDGSTPSRSEAYASVRPYGSSRRSGMENFSSGSISSAPFFIRSRGTCPQARGVPKTDAKRQPQRRPQLIQAGYRADHRRSQF